MEKENNDAPFFSISMPMYNVEQYLDKCIQSIINQSYTDFEIILVDDGSSDKSIEICKRWVERYPDKIKLIETKNEGSLLARRRCIKESRGKYLYILDSDDYLINNDMLKILKAKLDKYDCDMIVFGYTKDEKNFNIEVDYPFDVDRIYKNDELSCVYKYVLEKDSLNPLWNKIFKKDLIDIADYSNWKDVCIGTDRFQVIPIISKAKSIVFTKDVFYFYRTTENSIVHKFNKRLVYSLETSHRRLEQYAKEWNVVNKEEILATCFMKNVSSIAYKSRLITDKDNVSKTQFYKEIREIPCFKENYKKANYKKIGIARTIIIKLLNYKLYNCLNVLISIFANKK